MAHEDPIFREAVNTLVYIFGPKVYPDALVQDITWPEEFIAMMEEVTVAQGFDIQEYNILRCPSRVLQYQRDVHRFASAIRGRKQISIDVVDMYSMIANSPSDEGWYSRRVRKILQKLDDKNSKLSQSLGKYESYCELINCAIDPGTSQGELINKALTFCGVEGGVFEGPLLRAWCVKGGGTDLAEFCATYFSRSVGIGDEEKALSVLPIIYCVLAFWKGVDLGKQGDQGNQELNQQVRDIQILYDGSFDQLQKLVSWKHGAEYCRQKCDVYNLKTIKMV